MPIRLAYFLGFLAVCFLLLTSVYLQVFEGAVPCPLCALQRVIFVSLGMILLVGVVLHSRFWGRIVVNLLTATMSLLGILLAGRQIWMQYFPMVGNTECGVSLQYMLEVFPLHQALQKILFEGSTECTQRGWEFLHLNMAEWSLVWFILFLLLAVYAFLKEFKWHLH